MKLKTKASKQKNFKALADESGAKGSVVSFAQELLLVAKKLFKNFIFDFAGC